MEKISKEELREYGFYPDGVFDFDQLKAYFYGNDVESYFGHDLEVLENIKKYYNPVLELVANIDDGYVTSFSYAYGENIYELGLLEEDDLQGVIDWLRAGL